MKIPAGGLTTLNVMPGSGCLSSGQTTYLKMRSISPGTRIFAPRDLDLETLVEVLNGERLVHHHTHRVDDIMTVLRLQQDFGFKVVLHHLSEGWKVADQIAAVGVACSLAMGLDGDLALYDGGPFEYRSTVWAW